MRIPESIVDPCEYVVNHETALVDELSKWHNKTLRILLENHGLPGTAKDKQTLVQRVLDAVKEATISLKMLQDWSNKFLREGNRHLFIWDITPEDCNRLKNLEAMQTVFAEKELQKVDHLYQQVKDDLVLFNYTTLDGEIAKISLVYKEEKVLKVPDFSTDRIEIKKIDYYIFIDIYPLDEMMIINLDPISGLRESGSSDERVTVMNIAKIYGEEMESLFSFTTVESREITQKALYRIWKDATQYPIDELKEELDNLTDHVKKFVETWSKEELFNLSVETQAILVKKILSSFEIAIVKERYEEYQPLIEVERGKRSGFITQHKVRERTGGVFNQKSADNETPIEESDAFGDTVVTIDELERVQTLKFTWNGLQGIPPGNIPTTIDSTASFNHVVFARYTTVEEMDHVVSQLKRYKKNIRSTGSGI